MIKAFKIKNHLGESIYIDIRKPEATGFLITSVEGLGPVKAEISQTETAMFDGSLFSGCRLEPRNIVMNLLFFWDNNEKLSIEDIRHRSYMYFPVKKEIEVTVINDHGEFKINGVVETNEPPIFSDKEGTQISILCSDPYFEKEENDHLHYISRVVPNFQFPVSFEAVKEEETIRQLTVEFGLIKEYPETTIKYNGDDDSGVTVIFDTYGAASNIRINRTTGQEYLELDSAKITSITGHDIQEYDHIEINTRKGKKSAVLMRNGISYNIFSAVISSEKWIHMERGDNTFTFSATSGINNLRVYLDYAERFNGV